MYVYMFAGGGQYEEKFLHVTRGSQHGSLDNVSDGQSSGRAITGPVVTKTYVTMSIFVMEMNPLLIFTRGHV